MSYELEPIHYSAHFNLISFPTHFINHITEFILVTSVIFILLIQWVLFSSHLNWLLGSIQYSCIIIFIYHTNTLWVTILCWVQYLSFYFHDAAIYWFFTLHYGCNLSYSLIFLNLKMYELIRILSASSPGDFIHSLDFHLSWCQRYSNLYFQNHVINLQHIVLTRISKSVWNWVSLSPKMFIIFVLWCFAIVSNWWCQKVWHLFHIWSPTCRRVS